MFEKDVRAATAPQAPVGPGRRRRVSLRPVDAGLARLRALIGMGLSAELAGGAMPLRLEVTGALPVSSAPARQAVVQQTPGGPISVSPAREVVRALTAIDLPDDHDGDPLRPLRLELAAQAMPEGWFELFGASAVLSGAPDAGGPVEVTLTLVQPDAGLGLAATLQGTGEALLRMLSRPAWHRTRAAASPLPPDWALKVPVRLGHAEVSMRTCRELAAGDVLVMTHLCFDIDGDGNGDGDLRIGGRNAKCRLHLGNQTRLELTEWNPITTGSTMATSSFPSSDGDDALDDVPVALSFELGTLELTLSELKALAPGCVMPIAGTLPPVVAVCAAGRRIGTGELVDLDGRLGVEILRIGASS